jgi:predicted nuclease of restriction endonuclease-like RecB superfamily
MRVHMKMVSDWSTLPQVGKWQIKSTYLMHKRIHLQTWQSSDEYTFNQINHCLIDERHFSDVKDVMAQRSANIDPDHMQVVIKL